MIFKKDGKKIIEFKTDIAGLDKVAPVKPANYFIPQWFKDMKDFIEMPGNKQNLLVSLIKSVILQKNYTVGQ